MGQAKRRGSFEQRKAAAIHKAGIDREEKRRLEAYRLAVMTEEERQRKRDRELAMVQYISMCISMGHYPLIMPAR